MLNTSIFDIKTSDLVQVLLSQGLPISAPLATLISITSDSGQPEKYAKQIKIAFQ